MAYQLLALVVFLIPFESSASAYLSANLQKTFVHA